MEKKTIRVYPSIDLTYEEKMAEIARLQAELDAEETQSNKS